MKRMMKKLASIVLAGAMVMSLLSVTALASSPTTEPTTPATAQGTVSGNVNAPVTMPDDVFKIKMPTAASLAGTFNMYFDPHNLIRESKNALDTAGAGVDVNAFATDTLVYFKNVVDSTTTFSKTSDSVKIINKGNKPVNVNMTTTWSTGSGDSYILAKDTTDFDALKTDGKAALSLVLQDSRNNSSYVVQQDRSAPVMRVSTTSGAGTNAVSSMTVAEAETTLKALVKDIKFVYTDNADVQDMTNINVGKTDTGKGPANWSFVITPQAKKIPVVKFENIATCVPDYKSTNGTTVNSAPYKASDSVAVAINEYKNEDNSITYSLAAGTKAQSVIKITRGTSTNSPEVAQIIIDWDYEALGKLHEIEGGTNYTTEVSKAGANTTSAGDNKKVYLEFKADPGEGAKMDTALNRVDGAYEITKSGSNDLQYSLTSDFADEADEKFQSLSFNLTAAITDTEDCIEAWDTAMTANDGLLTVKWAVTNCEEVDPSATVTTEMASASDNAELKVDWGYGDKLTDSISAASFYNTSASREISVPADNIATTFVLDESDNSKVTVNLGNLATAFFNNSDGYLTVTFKNSKTDYTSTAKLKLVADPTT